MKMGSEISIKNVYKSAKTFNFKLISQLVAQALLLHILPANADDLRSSTSVQKFNYPAVCIFTDFVGELIPPISANLVRSKNTKRLDSEWVKSIPFAHSDLNYYFHRTETGIEIYFLFSSETATFVSASIPGKLLPPSMQTPKHLAWLFGMEINDLSKEQNELGCESVDLRFDISKDKQTVHSVNLNSAIE